MAESQGVASINRRDFLKTAGVATGAAVAGGIPGIVAAQKAPSFPKGTKLNILEWVSFVPASDVEFKRLAAEFPDRPEMRVSPETIYQSIYVQGRGALRRELAKSLRTGRALRKPRRKEGERRGKIPGMVMISERPAEAADRAVPGHWEGDLLVGAHGKSAIGTLVERTTRFTMLVPLPDGHDAPAVAEALTPVIAGLPDALRRSLTWDQGWEMRSHAQIAVAADCEIYFCDPHSPWQRGSNENMNGLLRDYFPKGTDLSVHPANEIARIAAEVNHRPRRTLAWQRPADLFDRALATA
jgi:IS30 family transposase